MKKTTFSILLAVLFLAQGIAQQVEQQQRSLITKRTADWCPYCGTWGWNFFFDAIDDNDDKAVLISAHYDGGLSSPAAEAITENFGGGYQPRFFLDDTDLGVSAGNVAAKLTSLKSQVDAAYLEAPIANVGFEPKYSNGEIKVDAKVRFFQAAQGEYQLGIYLLEDNVTAYQASIGNGAVHKALFRSSFTAEAFGLPLVNGDVAADQEFDLSFVLPSDDPADLDYEVVGIIWKKEGNKYKVVNVWSTEEIQEVSGTSISPVLSNSLSVAPTVASNSTLIILESIDQQPVSSLDVFDLNGRMVASVYEGALKSGQSTFELNREQVGGTGLYFVRLKTSDGVLVRKVVFR